MAVDGPSSRTLTLVAPYSSQRSPLRRSASVFVLALLLVLAGCQGYEPSVTPSPTPELPTPDTPDPRPSYEQGMADYEPLPTPENTSADTEANTTKIQLEIIALANEERAERGKTELTHDPRLSDIALNKSWMMGKEEVMHHDTGLSGIEQHEKANYNCGRGGENIARTPISGGEINWDLDNDIVHVNETALAEVIFTQWMDSDSHREMMLSDGVTTVGVGIYITIRTYDHRDGHGYQAWSTMHLCS